VLAADLDETEDAEEPRRTFNPFLLALLIVAVALIVTGFYIFQTVRELFLSTEVDYVTAQAVVYAAPLIVVLGVATAIGVLFVYAVRWKRSRR
jgi:hypothetical protein